MFPLSLATRKVCDNIVPLFLWDTKNIKQVHSFLASSFLLIIFPLWPYWLHCLLHNFKDLSQGHSKSFPSRGLIPVVSSKLLVYSYWWCEATWRVQERVGGVRWRLALGDVVMTAESGKPAALKQGLVLARQIPALRNLKRLGFSFPPWIHLNLYIVTCTAERELLGHHRQKLRSSPQRKRGKSKIGFNCLCSPLF